MIVCTQTYSDISPSWIIALLLRRSLWNSIKLWAMPCKTIQDGQVIAESSEKKVVHWRRKWQLTPVFLPQESYEQYEEAKICDTGRWTFQVGKCPICYHRNCCCSDSKSCPLFATPWTAAHQASLSFTIFQSLLKLISIELVIPSNHFILCCPLLLLPSIFPSFQSLSESFRVFFNKPPLYIRWPKYWSFSFSISH